MTGHLDAENDRGPHHQDDSPAAPLALRSLFGGLLMGLANLVPGISGGTMLLAAGVYPQFIDAVSNTTRFRFHRRSLLVLCCVVVAAGLSILLLAGSLKYLVVVYRWAMYSLFIGLTFGGIPVVWRLAKPAHTSLVVSAVFAFLLMVALAVLQAYGIVGGSGSNMLMLFVAGLAGASAMILPGLSGSYLLLLLGQYVPILQEIDNFKDALKSRDIAAAMGPAVNTLLPVGIGIVVGVVLVGNLLQWLLRKHRKPILGVLLGLLVGSSVGLYPFQMPVRPVIGQVIKGQEVTDANIASFMEDKDDWLTTYFTPTLSEVFGSLALIAVGFGITAGIAKIGGEEAEH